MTKTPYSKDDIEVLEFLFKLTTGGIEYDKNSEEKLGDKSYNNNHIIDEDKQEEYEDEYLFRNEFCISTDKFVELEKANSYIYATFRIHQCNYKNIPFSKRFEVFNVLWQVVFGKKDKEDYLEITKNIAQSIYSIEIIRNFPDKGTSESFML